MWRKISPKILSCLAFTKLQIVEFTQHLPSMCLSLQLLCFPSEISFLAEGFNFYVCIFEREMASIFTSPSGCYVGVSTLPLYMHRNMRSRPYFGAAQHSLNKRDALGSRDLSREHPSFPSSGTVWMRLNKESCLPAVGSLAAPRGAWQSRVSKGSPRHAGAPMTRWCVPSRGLVGPALTGPGKGRAVRAKSFCLCQRGNVSARERLPVPENDRVFGTRAVCMCVYAPTWCHWMFRGKQTPCQITDFIKIISQSWDVKARSSRGASSDR